MVRQRWTVHRTAGVFFAQSIGNKAAGLDLRLRPLGPWAAVNNLGGRMSSIDQETNDVQDGH